MKKFIFIVFMFLSTFGMQAQTINVAIDWNTTIQTISSRAYGVNSPANFIPSFSADLVFMANLELVTQKKGLVRLHGWGMIDETSPEYWLNTDGSWNSTKINSALTPLVQQGYEVMINIPSGSLGEDDYLNIEDFAQFCADLVQVVNVDNQLNITYWELPNEREQGFADPGLTINQMSALLKAASQAMKAIDPTIQVGGAATAWVNIDYLTSLVQMTPEMDFISCHTYSGDCTNELQDIYNIAQFAIEDLYTLRQNIDNITSGLPIYLTEYNLSYQGCDFIQSNEGAVYDAMMMTESMKAGLNATCYWAMAPYSDMSLILGSELNDNAYLFEIMNRNFQGDLVSVNSSDSSKVLIYATKNQETNQFSFSLINRSASVQNVQIQMTGISPANLDKYMWDGENSFLSESTSWTDLNNGDLSLTPYSVNFFTGLLDPLPIEIMTFDGEQIRKNHRLSWVTVSEINASHFGVEWSIDGIEWTDIGVVYTQKDGAEQKMYVFNYQPDSKTSYYRLRMVDLDGSFKHSKIIYIAGRYPKIEVFPNPIKSRLQLLNVHNKVPIQIFNSAGTLVWKGRYDGLSLSLENYESGVYYLKIKNKKGLRFVIE